MTSTQRVQHPARWPLLDLDVAKIRETGHQAVPFRQFILKVHSRCNLSCSYCYVYEMADQGWRGLPQRMSQPVVGKTVERIAEHAERHGLPSVDVILHGGEPLLAGAEWLADLVGSLRARVPARVNVAVQTNGTLLDRPMLATLKRLEIKVGVSLDGDAEATGRHRRYANGRNSFDAVGAGLDLLRSPEFADCYGGILCTIDVVNDPLSTYEALLKFSPPALDLLLPHANWSSPPPGDGYADWLISDLRPLVHRATAGDPNPPVQRADPARTRPSGPSRGTRAAAEHADRGRHRRLHQATRLAQLGLSRRRRRRLGRHVRAASTTPLTIRPRWPGRSGSRRCAAECQSCPVMEICGGGLYPHRFRAGEGFRNPSVYCEDLLKLITHVRDRVLADLAALGSH